MTELPPLPFSPVEVSDLILRPRERAQRLGWLNRDALYPENQVLAYGKACAAAEREACSALCSQRSADHWHDLKDPASPFRGDPRPKAMADEAEQCAGAIKERGNQNG